MVVKRLDLNLERGMAANFAEYANKCWNVTE